VASVPFALPSLRSGSTTAAQQWIPAGNLQKSADNQAGIVTIGLCWRKCQFVGRRPVGPSVLGSSAADNARQNCRFHVKPPVARSVKRCTCGLLILTTKAQRHQGILGSVSLLTTKAQKHKETQRG